VKIIDEFTDRDDLSRSMKCLLRKQRDGKCRVGGCRNPVKAGGFCAEHLIGLYKKQHHRKDGHQPYRCRARRIMEGVED
jgi:hypothetical protein